MSVAAPDPAARGDRQQAPEAKDSVGSQVPSPHGGLRSAGPALSSSLGRRRLQRFRRNRRAYVSLWILVGLVLCSGGAELIANDVPLVVRYDGAWMFPVLKSYPETRFGGEFPTEARYQDREVQDLVRAKGGFLLWPLVRFDASSIDLYLEEPAPSPPSRRHWLGTDDVGRDIFARLLYGFRLSLGFGLVLTLVSSLIGVTAGGVQGYFGGWVDLLFQRGIEVFAGMPVLFLLIILASFVEPGLGSLLGLLLLFSWIALVGVVRAEFLRARQFDYVRAARALGVPSFTIMRRHVLPNAVVATLTFLPFVLAGSVTTLTALDFLGLGLPIGSASLGEVLQQGKGNLWAPWIGLSAFAVLSVLLVLIIFVSEGLRDAFDPRRTVA